MEGYAASVQGPLHFRAASLTTGPNQGGRVNNEGGRVNNEAARASPSWPGGYSFLAR